MLRAGLLVAAAGLVVAGTLAGLWALRPPAPKTAVPAAPAAAAPRPGSEQVLLVLPSRRFWFPDYESVAAELQKRKIPMRVTSSANPAQPDPLSKHVAVGAHPVPADYLLADVKLSDFDAVIFGGGEGITEYLQGGENQAAVQRLIADARAQNKPVAAICMGPAVLADAHYLEGKRAVAYDRPVVRGAFERGKVIYVPGAAVEVAGPFITGRDWYAADDVVEALAVALHRGEAKKPGR